MILICCNCHESCLGENERLEVFRQVDVFVLRRGVGDVKSGLISVHRVQYDLEKKANL